MGLNIFYIVAIDVLDHWPRDECKTETPHVTIGPLMRMYICMKMIIISLFQILVFVHSEI